MQWEALLLHTSRIQGSFISMSSLCPCCSSQGSLASAISQIHAGILIDYVRLTLGANVCVNIALQCIGV